jgi:tetratricopeptide (TPR) repeat protein
VPMVTEAMVERRMYLPLAAMIPLAAAVGYEVIRQFFEPAHDPADPPARASVAVGLACVAALTVAAIQVTERRIEDYHDELSIWRAAEAIEPNDFLVQVNLGIALGKMGRNDEALGHFIDGARLAPDSFHAHYNLARAFDQAGRSSEALGHYLDTLRIKPRFAPAHNNAGRLLANLGKTDQAIRHYEEAIQIKKDFAAAHNNLGILLAENGELARAIDHLQQAAEIRPDFETYFNLALVYSLVDRRADAIAMAEKSLRMAREQNQAGLAERIDEWLTAYRNASPP